MKTCSQRQQKCWPSLVFVSLDSIICVILNNLPITKIASQQKGHPRRKLIQYLHYLRSVSALVCVFSFSKEEMHDWSHPLSLSLKQEIQLKQQIQRRSTRNPLLVITITFCSHSDCSRGDTSVQRSTFKLVTVKYKESCEFTCFDSFKPSPHKPG